MFMDFMGLHDTKHEETDSVSSTKTLINDKTKNELRMLTLEDRLNALEAKQQDFDKVKQNMSKRIKFLEELNKRHHALFVQNRIMRFRDYLFLSFPCIEKNGSCKIPESKVEVISSMREFKYSEEYENDCIDQLIWYVSSYPVIDQYSINYKRERGGCHYFFSQTDFLKTCEIVLNLALENRKNPKGRMSQTLQRILLSQKSTVSLQIEFSKLDGDAGKMHNYLSYNRHEHFRMMLS